MTNFQQFHSLLRKLNCCNSASQTATALKEVAVALQSANKNDLQELLALLCTTPDNDLKLKLMSILSAHLILDNINCGVIITYRPIYDMVLNLLSNGLCIKTKVILNFVLALLTTDEEASSSLSLFAKNILRVSGCLAIMCDIFVSGMMYQDIWIALCHCIAEACNGCEVNQNYCAHIIPLSIKRCCLGNTDVCIVLQSLLCQNHRNVKLFLESGGESIFTRQLLQNDICMTLLNNLVQISNQAVQLLCDSGLLHLLREFLQLYGPHSQIGQWSTIILYHVGSRINGNVSFKQQKNLQNDKRQLVKEVSCGAVDEISYAKQGVGINKGAVDEISYAKQGVGIKKIGGQNYTLKQRPLFERTQNVLEDSLHVKQVNDVSLTNDTANLFRNVIKEVLLWKSKNEVYNKKSFTLDTNTNLMKDERKNTNQLLKYVCRQTKGLNVQRNNFSFASLIDLDKARNDESEKPNDIVGTHVKRTYNPLRSALHDQELSFSSIRSSQKGMKNINPTFSATENTVSKLRESVNQATQTTEIDIRQFKPTFVSTPKRVPLKCSTINSNFKNKSQITLFSRKTKNKRGKIQKPNKDKSKRTPNTTSKDAKLSISARLFSAINDSCTTFVKSVKNIFTKKKDQNDEKNSSSFNIVEEENNASCSFSFTNYMRKRDAILQREMTVTKNIQSEDFNSFRESCRTCEDTIVLQYKMNTDEHLHRTIKKLKTGVHLYGCDFKKISRVMWPRDKYMTPGTIYNLYRKLILNSGNPKNKY